MSLSTRLTRLDQLSFHFREFLMSLYTSKYLHLQLLATFGEDYFQHDDYPKKFKFEVLQKNIVFQIPKTPGIHYKIILNKLEQILDEYEKKKFSPIMLLTCKPH